MNLLSEGIINADGSPGPNSSRTPQFQASDAATFGDGTLNTTTSMIPPVSTSSIGNVLEPVGVSIACFGGVWNQYVCKPNNPSEVFCNLCDQFLCKTFFVSNPALRTTVNKDTSNLYADFQSDVLPAAAFVKLAGPNDGHPASSKASISAAFIRKILTELWQQPNLRKSTAGVDRG